METTTTSSSAASSSPEPTTPRLIKEDELEDEGRESPPEISSSTSDCSAGHSGGRSSKKSPPTSPPPPKNPLLQERFSCEELRHAVCHLETKDLWDKFNDLGTEMIITKSGRSVPQFHFAQYSYFNSDTACFFFYRVYLRFSQDAHNTHRIIFLHCTNWSL